MTQTDRPPDTPPARAPAAAGPRRVAGGFTVAEYEARVWEMAKHHLHPTAIYVVAVVAGATRLFGHALLDEPGTGAAVEAGLFACVFLGAWACFWSTLLRVAGLPSRTITILVPLAVAAALAVWTVVPAPSAMDAATFWIGAASLGAPGPVAFAVTYRVWRRHRREHAHLLPEADR